MTIIFDDVIINYDNVVGVYKKEGILTFDLGAYMLGITGYRDDTLLQIAKGVATGKSFIEASGKLVPYWEEES